ncbi:DUF4132 domain-containing protein [Kordia algicida OT-1]|uniref:Uncharacterized protein n=1 Tax=Kordia algicida OT-1 TaxID=391587 RepID=A9DNJ1_9FLAO|nr:DUF4132 domain-containing protein [Kordia algicida]EDP97204.1 hypothetical protein KAOT1_18617 [Kordia algicida OT-1]
MGFADSLKNLFSSKKESKTLQNSPFDEQLKKIMQDAFLEGYTYTIKFSTLKSYNELKAKDATTKKEFVQYLAEKKVELLKISVRRSLTNVERNKSHICGELVTVLLRSNLEYKPSEIAKLLDFFANSSSKNNLIHFTNWPIGYVTQQIEKSIKKNGVTSEWRSFIEKFLASPVMNKKDHYWGVDLEKVATKLKKILFEDQNTDGKTLPYVHTNDRFGEMFNPKIITIDENLRDHFYQLCHLFSKATSGKPSQRFLKNTSKIIDEIGIAKYKTTVHPWLEFVIQLKEIEKTVQNTYSGRVYEYTYYEFLHEKSTAFLKGLVWSLAKFHDTATLNLIAKLAERCYKKIPGVGPAAAGIGNACIYVLGNTKGLEGISHLSRLKLKIKQNNTRKLIEKYIEAASTKLGVSSSEIEELSIPHFGLTNGAKTIAFDDYTLEITIQELGKVNLIWRKPDGKQQKTTPAFVKNSAKHAHTLKKAKSDVAQIKKYLTAQRDRIDRLYLDDRIWTYENFTKHYLDHGLVSFIAKRLLWQFKKEDTFVTAFYLNDQWTTQENTTLDWISEETEVRLWHPIYEAVNDVLFWRKKLEELEIKQPLKQAYREVYILTDAEINTKTYSNRMAAHILKQHQFNALTSIRGWKYSLMGAFDNGIDAEMATIHIKAHDIQAQFWINELNAEDEFNDTGIWNYVATDQVRFLKNEEVMDMIDVPKLVLSEILRDVDLFVGVSSVGNDPEWRDNGGLPQYHNYWTSYSFGDLTEVAKTRKQILEKLLPRLKINKVATIDGKFLRVKGTKRTYKIHIGSSNILMEPNDQYLCIVPARGKDKNTSNIFLPFEGDRGLSLVLSKAFLLAEDHKITDVTILSQIR